MFNVILGSVCIVANILWLFSAMSKASKKEENSFDLFLAVFTMNVWALPVCFKMINGG